MWGVLIENTEASVCLAYGVKAQSSNLTMQSKEQPDPFSSYSEFRFVF